MSRSRGIPFCIALLLAFSANLAAQITVFKWVCDPKDKTHRFYRSDLGVVCWDGGTYSKDDAGGIPQYMLDYFKENRQKLQQKIDEMNQHNSDLKAARPANSAAPRRPVTPLGSASGTVVRAAAPPTVPVSPELFASIDVGMARSDVLDKLGKAARFDHHPRRRRICRDVDLSTDRREHRQVAYRKRRRNVARSEESGT